MLTKEKRGETCLAETYVQRAALLACTFRQSRGGGWGLGDGQRCRARETSTSDTGAVLGSLYVTSRCTTLSVSTCVALLPRPCVSPSLSLMNSIAINSIKTSGVLGGFYSPGSSWMYREREETRSHRKCSKQSSQRSMNLSNRRITDELCPLNLHPGNRTPFAHQIVNDFIRCVFGIVLLNIA